MAEGAERFRGLWEDEMFARQVGSERPVSPELVSCGIDPPATPPTAPPGVPHPIGRVETE